MIVKKHTCGFGLISQPVGSYLMPFWSELQLTGCLSRSGSKRPGVSSSNCIKLPHATGLIRGPGARDPERGCQVPEPEKWGPLVSANCAYGKTWPKWSSGHFPATSAQFMPASTPATAYGLSEQFGTLPNWVPHLTTGMHLGLYRGCQLSLRTPSEPPRGLENKRTSDSLWSRFRHCRPSWS